MVRWLAGMFVWWAQLAGSVLAVEAQAQDAAAPAGYEQTLARAFQDFEQRRFVEAGTLFREAHRRFPNAHTLRALGMVEYELEHYVEAVDLLQRALESHARPLAPELRASTTQLLRQARAHVTLVRVTFSPPQALFLVDGLAVSVASGDLLQLSAGEHELILEARGYTPARRVLRVSGGEPLQELSLALLPIASAPRAASRPLLRNPWLWTAVGAVVAAGLTAGLVIGLNAPENRAVQTGTTGVRIEVPSAGSAAR